MREVCFDWENGKGPPREGRALRFWGGGTLPQEGMCFDFGAEGLSRKRGCASILGWRDSPARGVRFDFGAEGLSRERRCAVSLHVFLAALPQIFTGVLFFFLKEKEPKRTFSCASRPASKIFSSSPLDKLFILCILYMYSTNRSDFHGTHHPQYRQPTHL